MTDNPRHTFGRYFKLLGPLLGIPLGLAGAITEGLGGAAIGASIGVAIATAAARGFYAHAAQFREMRRLLSNEGLEKDGGASRGFARGWLFLTKKRLVFVVGKSQDVAQSLEIPVADIVSTDERFRPKQPNELVITTPTRTYSFAVDPRDYWSAALDTRGNVRLD